MSTAHAEAGAQGKQQQTPTGVRSASAEHGGNCPSEHPRTTTGKTSPAPARPVAHTALSLQLIGVGVAIALSAALLSPANAGSDSAALVPIFLADLLAALFASLAVAPLAQMVDVAVSRSAAGDATVSSALLQGATDAIRNPLDLLRQPAFVLVWFVYLCTYTGANLTEDVCTEILHVSPVLPKLVAATTCNMVSCMYKDSALAQLYGKQADARPFPAIGYALFLLRDVIANGGGFTLPPLAAPLLDAYFGARSTAVAQLLVPAAVNLVTSPLHFLALSIYNNPGASAWQHASSVAQTYVSATSSRTLKGLAAFGLGGLSNTAIRSMLAGRA